MGVPTSEVGYTSAMPRREDNEVRQGHVGHWIKKKKICKIPDKFTRMAKPTRITSVREKWSSTVLEAPI